MWLSMPVSRPQIMPSRSPRRSTRTWRRTPLRSHRHNQDHARDDDARIPRWTLMVCGRSSMSDQGSFFQRDRTWHPPAYTPRYKTSILRSPQHALLSLENTISESTGPVFGHNKLGPLDNDLIRNYAKTGDPIGQRIVVYGRVLDENARPVPGALLEFWQANAGGRYRHKKETYLAAIDPNFGGC